MCACEDKAVYDYSGVFRWLMVVLRVVIYLEVVLRQVLRLVSRRGRRYLFSSRGIYHVTSAIPRALSFVSFRALCP
jgi:hypothetical protein